VYTDEERAIFRFKVNGSDRAVDPIATMRTLQTYENFDLEADYAIISTIDFDGETMTDRGQMEALSRFIDACRKAFDLQPFKDGEGVLDSEVIEIMSKFFIYLDSVKKKRETSLTSADSTAEMLSAAN